MRIELHRLVASDISRIMEYYEDVAGLGYSQRPLRGRNMSCGERREYMETVTHNHRTLADEHQKAIESASF